MPSVSPQQNFVVPQGGGGARRGGGVVGVVMALLGRKWDQEDAIQKANLDVATYGKKRTIDTQFHEDKTRTTLEADKEKITHKDTSAAATKVYTERESAKTKRRHASAVNKITNKGRKDDAGNPVNPSDWNPNIAEVPGVVKMQRTGQKVKANPTPLPTDPNPPTPSNPGSNPAPKKRKRKSNATPTSDGNPVGGPWV